MAYILTDRDIENGFWCYRPDDGFPPGYIQNPEEYDGLPALNVACTQTGLPSHKQANLVKQWCEVLPTLVGLEFLWFNSKVPQNLFDAACMVPGLKGLYIKWSGIKSIVNIVNSRNLKFLHIGSSTQLVSIEPLRELDGLIWLELENIKRVSDLTVIGELRRLQGLQISGSMWTTQIVDSLAPLARLQRLRHLSIPNLKAKDKTLSPLFSLSSLEKLHSALWWSEEEMRLLRKANPKL